MTQPSSTKMTRTTFSNCFHIIKRRRLITAELQQAHLPVGRHFQVQAAHRQRVETLRVLKCSRSSIFPSWWCGRRTQVLTTKMYTFSPTDSRQIHWVELSPLWSRSPDWRTFTAVGSFSSPMTRTDRTTRSQSNLPSSLPLLQHTERAQISSEEFPEAKNIILRFCLRILRQRPDFRSPELMTLESLLSLTKSLCVNYFLKIVKMYSVINLYINY